MKSFLPTLAASALLLGLACSPSSALVVGQDNFVFSTGTQSANFGGITTPSFSDMFTLQLLNAGDTSISFTSTFSGKGQPKTKFTTFSLTDGANTYSSLDLGPVFGNPAKPTLITGYAGDIFVTALTAGTYTLTLGGTAVASNGTFPNYGGTFSVTSVPSVPLPASLPMFGAALLGLGAVGYSLKRKGESQGLTFSA